MTVIGRLHRIEAQGRNAQPDLASRERSQPGATVSHARPEPSISSKSSSSAKASKLLPELSKISMKPLLRSIIILALFGSDSVPALMSPALTVIAASEPTFIIDAVIVPDRI